MEFFRDHPQMLLLGGLLLITMFFISRITKRRKRGPTSILNPHEQLERLKQARGMRGDLEQLMVEIEQMAKRMGAQLDAKSMRIERLLDEADQRIEQLQKLEARALAQNDTQGDSRIDSLSADSDTTASTHGSLNATGEAADHASGLANENASEHGSPHSQPAAAPAVDALPQDPLARSVYALADQGNDPQQIAKELQEHVGKVELILALRTA